MTSFVCVIGRARALSGPTLATPLPATNLHPTFGRLLPVDCVMHRKYEHVSDNILLSPSNGGLNTING